MMRRIIHAAKLPSPAVVAPTAAPDVAPLAEAPEVVAVVVDDCLVS